MDKFVLKAPYQPTGDQPQAIEALVKGFREGNQCQTLLGVTGSGKTFTMANVIQALNKPTLVIAHNKTLAAQLYGEFKEMFPDNAVEYFVSYYDYYQPEAYVPSSDTYIAKDSSINEEIDKLRLSATASLIERRDVIIVSSVSCIYGLGEPENFEKMMVSLRPGMQKDRDEVLRQLIDIQYDRNDMDFKRGTFRVRGDVVEIIPANEADTAVRVEFFGDEIDRIVQIDVLTGEIRGELEHIAIFPGVPLRGACGADPPGGGRHRAGAGGAGPGISRARESFLKPSGSRSGRILTSRCSKRLASAPGSRTIPAISRGWRRGSRPTRCWTISRMTSS